MATTDIKVKDDATLLETTLVKVAETGNETMWRGNNPLIPLEAQLRLTMTVEALKRGHRVSLKTEVPVMETLGASGTSDGYVAPPKVAYVIPVITTMFVDPRCTATDRANALKVHECAVLGASNTSGQGLLGITAVAAAYLNSVLPAPLMFTGLVRPA